MDPGVEIVPAHDAPTTQLHSEHVWTSLPHGQLFDFTDVEFTDGFFIDDGNMEFTVPTDLGSIANTSSGQPSQIVHNFAHSSINAASIDLQNQGSPDFSDLVFSPLDPLQSFENIGNKAGDAPQPFETLQAADAPAPSHSDQNNAPGIQKGLHQQPSSLSDTPETVKHIFDNQLYDVLSIQDDQTTNPWQVHVWPMADNCPALYHALAAMAYSYTSKSQPQLRAAGLEHYNSSLQALVQGKDNTSMSLDGSVAARLALSYVDFWDDEQASSGIEHVRVAEGLLREAIDKYKTTRLTGEEMDRLNFLARTWVYKAVMTRLTTPYEGGSVDLESMEAYIQLDPLPLEQQLDPLMGCAITLFPLLERLADIVKSVRRRTERHNSAFLISKGAELRMKIEGWSPSFDPDRSGGFTSHNSDIIQTAEAYRWAALLLLRQAIPELPWVHSFWEHAEKVSIYLATTPVTSRTMLVQTFPLMAIAGEAFDVEDRDWVRQRWAAMSKRMPIARLDRCRRVTEEVWRRRDAFEAKCGACPSCGAFRLASPGTSPTADTMAATTVPFASSNHIEGGSRRCRCSATTTITAGASGFPDSLAFKKGIDNITRGGNLHYTVRGDLHWLRVMKDWGWEVMLG
ncbi:hypothetical protein LTR10_023941 [Elasticomyces elasticus]|nr:hypothetical protein LTR10_023941 [Elasticomyces elasticus]